MIFGRRMILMSNLGNYGKKFFGSYKPKKFVEYHIPASNINFDDVTHAITWDKSDYVMVRKKFAMMRAAFNRRDRVAALKLNEDFDNQIERIKNDQTSEFEVLDIAEKRDKIPNPGRTRAAELITGWVLTTFDFMAIGTAKDDPTDGDFALLAEVGRANSRTNGYVGPAGGIIKHICAFPPGFPSGDYWEVAPVDTPVFDEEQSIWARVVFPANKAVQHDVGEDFFTIHHATYTTSSA